MTIPTIDAFKTVKSLLRGEAMRYRNRIGDARMHGNDNYAETLMKWATEIESVLDWLAEVYP